MMLCHNCHIYGIWRGKKGGGEGDALNSLFVVANARQIGGDQFIWERMILTM